MGYKGGDLLALPG